MKRMMNLAATSAALALSLFPTGCASSTSPGGPEPDGGVEAGADGGDGVGTDAAPPSAQVAGTALGVVAGVSLVLHAEGSAHDLEIDSDGAFSFAATWPTGTPYALSIGTGQPCVLDRAAGTIGIDPPHTLTCDGVVALATLELDAFVALEPAFAPETTSYSLAASPVLQRLGLRAEAAYPDATISLSGGAPAPALSAQLELAAALTISLEVTHPSGLRRSYEIAIAGDAELVERHKQTDANPVDGAAFGAAIVSRDDRLIIGAPGLGDDTYADVGAVMVYRFGMGGLVLETTLHPAHPHAGALFGSSLAYDGEFLLVGIPNDDSSGVGINPPLASPLTARDSGAVELFRRQGPSWSRIARIKSPRPRAYDNFGASVALADSSFFVGAPGVDAPTQILSGTTPAEVGAAYGYRMVGTTVTSEALLRPASLRNHHRFGQALAYAGGDLIVGTPGDNSATGDPADAGAAHAGAAWVYRYEANAWRVKQYLKSPLPEPGANYGRALAIEGELLAVGCPGASGPPPVVGLGAVSGVGAVALLRRQGEKWLDDGRLTPGPQRFGVGFGGALALRAPHLAIGAALDRSGAAGVDPVDDASTSFQSGAVHLFDLDTGTRRHVVKASDPTEFGFFGSAVALSERGLAIGAIGANGSYEHLGPGAVYLYQ